MRINIFITILLMLGFISCVDVINLDLPEKDKRLVVEGLITNWDTVYTVKLSKTSKYSFKINDASNEMESGAMVIISDDTGISDTLHEVNAGIYQTIPPYIHGIVGRTYKLDIFTASGKHYISAPEKMTHAPKIDSIYFERDPNDRIRNGYKNTIYLDWQDPSDTANYYLHHFSYFWGNQWHPENEWTRLFSDNMFNGQYVRKYMASTGHDGYGFYVRITRYSLSKRAYEFWNLLNQQLYPTDDGVVTSSVPLVGNIYNVDNSDDFALGYFQVSGKVIAQVYIDH